ncbi:MAG: T9SS type A sorting domain-containing protein [Bacteroidales bacterium]|jgi:hypothetical protein|nr:T9SS type A sorting domain-containing protein [Bacteroidales bacterium]MCK9498154.1 T9SS type A sorting domain-containing protein [Bacteroidales bacterium]
MYKGGDNGGFYGLHYGDTCTYSLQDLIVYKGGSGGGFSGLHYGDTCNYLSLTIYFGGLGDGFANICIDDMCDEFNAEPYEITQFTGGAGDGFASFHFGDTCIYNLPILTAFTGGAGSGFANLHYGDTCYFISNPLVAYAGGDGGGFNNAHFGDTCFFIPNLLTVYTGGEGGGFDYLHHGDTCVYDPPFYIAYAGGVSDGFSNAHFGDTCSFIQILYPMYVGGVADGFDYLHYGNTCYYKPVMFFYGGIGDGYGFIQYYNCGQLEDMALPIELLKFVAFQEDDKVRLEWISLTEINNEYFSIEHSLDATNWISIANIPGAGNSNTAQSYFEYDYYPEEGINYYRLKQTDFDRKHTYSKIIYVDYKLDDTQITLFPNPFKDVFTVDLGTAKETSLNYQIFSSSGKLIQSNLLTTSGQFDINLEQESEGVYIFKIIIQGKVNIFRIVKMK